jgi:UDP-N-acetylmuramoyl-tripeptide--D-alanyl-D-alanine ligase
VIPLALEEIARLCPGHIELGSGAVVVTGLEIDSRRIGAGDLFVAVRGGVDFVEDALDRGAAAALVPKDAFQALAALGAAVRERIDARVVGITGATGKTSTKDILAALCRPHRRTVAAEQSLNNEIGLPLTVTRATRETEIVICELGTRGPGQVAELCQVARPHLGVIAQVGPAHLELFGTVEAVAAAEAEIVAALPPGGTVVVPAGEELLEPHLARADLEVVTYGEGGDVRLLEFAPDGTSRLEVELFGERLSLEFGFRARHNATNALAALAAYSVLGLPLFEAQRGARDVSLSRWREDERMLAGGGALINDAYNANPVSMSAALEHLAERARGRRRVAVLGEMAELGAAAPGYHAEVGQAASRAEVTVLVAVGPLARTYLEAANGVAERHWAETAEEAIPVVRSLLRPGDCVLVKGSRAAGLEVLADAIAPIPER